MIKSFDLSPDCTPHAAALMYADHGWRVLPAHSPLPNGACTCTKADCKHPGNHPRLSRWTEAASSEREFIDRWFLRMWPEANIGILTGSASGIVAIDVDARHGGFEAFAELEERHGPAPATLAVRSGGGGLHLYFRHPMDRHVKTVAGQVAPGVDVRGDGGWVTAPPSLHRSGGYYTWSDVAGSDGVLWDGYLPLLPEWLIPAARVPIVGAASPDDPIPEGQRNQVLTRLAGAMRRHGAPQEAIVAGLAKTNELRCDPPLEQSEVAAIAASIARYQPETALAAGGGSTYRPFEMRRGQVTAR